MIEGWFDARGRPYVAALVILPRLQIPPRQMEFLVDTGADETSLHPKDGNGIPYHDLRHADYSDGVGGPATYYSEQAIIVFEDSSGAHVYFQPIGIAEPTDYNLSIPSLLGQDILRHWRIIHDRPANQLSFEVKRADLTIL